MDGSKKIVEANVIVGEIFARKKFFHNFFFFGLHLNLAIIRANNNPIFDLGSLRDFEDVENVSEMVAETSEASKDQQSESATSESSCFANLSERGLEKILEDKQSNKTKKDTNWCVSTFKGEFQTEIVILFLYMIKNKHMKS